MAKPKRADLVSEWKDAIHEASFLSPKHDPDKSQPFKYNKARSVLPKEAKQNLSAFIDSDNWPKQKWHVYAEDSAIISGNVVSGRFVSRKALYPRSARRGLESIDLFWRPNFHTHLFGLADRPE